MDGVDGMRRPGSRARVVSQFHGELDEPRLGLARYVYAIRPGGTEFAVDVDSGGLTRVGVLEGSVEVRSSDWDAALIVAAGSSVRLEGVVEGGVLTGTWSEAPTYAPPVDAGRLVLRPTPDGDGLRGSWGYGQATDDGTWEGVREER